MPIYLRWYVIIAIAFVIMCFFYPGKAHPKWFFTQQMFVSFTHFVEALCLVSQLYHL